MTSMPLFAAETVTNLPIDYWPFAILAVCITFIIVTITKLRFHPFVALILAAFIAGFMAKEFKPAHFDKISSSMRGDSKANKWVAAVELTSAEFGGAAGGIAISIGLASIIGLCLMESGAADKVVRRFLGVFGERNAGAALLASTYILSIPIFFDTMFMLMVPLAKALRLRTGKDYLLYLMCICAGGAVTHSLTVPHPGPLAMVDSLHVDPGIAMLVGIVAGILPCVAGYYVAAWVNKRVEIPLRETPGQSLKELEGISNKAESELPSFFWSIIPVILPIVLIAAASFIKIALPNATPENMPDYARIMLFLGNKNIALALGTLIALGVLVKQRDLGLGRVEQLLGPPIETAGVIILITASGGAFGGMLRNAGVGDTIAAVARNYDINLVLLAWLTAAVIRVAQGSATVALLTTSAMLWPMVDPAVVSNLPFNRMYIFIAIGFGSFCCSWMNDSGFWVVSRLSGMTEKETLKSWTLMLTSLSVFGMILALVFSKLMPMV